MKKGKNGQASLVAVVLLLILVMVLVVIGVVILIVNPSILGLVATPAPVEQLQPQIITIQTTTPAQPLCTYPYTQVGNTCCLDKNFNGICDSDEIVKENIPYCSYPYLKQGTSCCLDENDNGRCDDEDYRHNHDYYDNRFSSSYLDFPFDLRGVSIRSDEIEMTISNQGDYDYIIKSIEIDGCDTIDTNRIIYENQNSDFTIHCDSDIANRDVTIDYKNRNGDSERSSGGRIRKD
jgi:hypothetical protein